jgi:hypothetical protein
VNSSTRLTVVSPAGSGYVRIWVTTAGGRAGSNGTFHYRHPTT